MLARARQAWWQVLPLGPTGYGNSPYQCFSAFAGNPLLISPELLARAGILNAADLAAIEFKLNPIAYEDVIPFKSRLIAKAWENFQVRNIAEWRPRFEEFCHESSGWLDDYALFMALKKVHGGVSWQCWPKPLMTRNRNALDKARIELQAMIGQHQFEQFLFHQQWQTLREYAHQQGVRLIGDLPIFVAMDSVDVWSHPELFSLDEQLRPVSVAGVPPDYFSATGQLWGNPLYAWDAHRKDGYSWWIARLKAALQQVDLIRLDHFRGFEAYWEIPSSSATAETGRWVPGPGAQFFELTRAALGGLPLIAENLGVITADVESLRTHLGLPGMRILQFAFGGAREDRFLPHHYDRNTVVYTGTHDNDTTMGWYCSLKPTEVRFLRRYVPGTDEDVAWDLIRVAWASVADTAIVPLQDVLSLGTEARMNFPGRPSGNWQWRVASDMITEKLLDKLGELTAVYQRCL